MKNKNKKSTAKQTNTSNEMFSVEDGVKTDAKLHEEILNNAEAEKKADLLAAKPLISESPTVNTTFSPHVYRFSTQTSFEMRSISMPPVAAAESDYRPTGARSAAPTQILSQRRLFHYDL
jgi:hypothetical protein